MVRAEFDYVIVGGGTAGCVLAARLSEDPTVRVLLLEAGPKPRSLWIGMPAGMGRLFVNSRYNWGFESEPEPHLGGRALYWPQGKTLGGSSAINGMAFVRGQPEDYDRWAELGADGWSWKDVLPWFRCLEDRPEGGPLRGVGGPLRISDPSFVHSSAQAFIGSAQGIGLPLNPDYNGEAQEGVGLLQFTIRNGMRASAWHRWLKPALGRRNLRVETEASVDLVQVSQNRATGVRWQRDGVIHDAQARCEVIVAAGAINSPRLLLKSGIGAAGDLQSLGIEPLANLPAVGRNLTDHPYIHMTYRVGRDASLNAELQGWRVYWHGLRWLAQARGPLTIGASQAVAFASSVASADRPDLQINFRPISHAFDSAGRLGPDPVPRVTAAICALRPTSRGRVWLKNRAGDVGMVGGYAANDEDRELLVAGVRLARRIFTTGPLGDLVSSEDKPGLALASDEQGIRNFIRDTVQPMAHPVGTCRIGRDHGQSVVDGRLRVHGFDGLRVIDSSVMPEIVSGNTVAATYMIAEKGADMVRADRCG